MLKEATSTKMHKIVSTDVQFQEDKVDQHTGVK